MVRQNLVRVVNSVAFGPGEPQGQVRRCGGAAGVEATPVAAADERDAAYRRTRQPSIKDEAGRTSLPARFIVSHEADRMPEIGFWPRWYRACRRLQGWCPDRCVAARL